jgi:hypothetical protein
MIFCGHFILQIDLSYFEVVGFERSGKSLQELIATYWTSLVALSLSRIRHT